ncbi:aldo/keto reductase [Alphaproteobacteria bacterium]|nr:aldo/keto reductase [Alphaproteobacteria bacterium]
MTINTLKHSGLSPTRIAFGCEPLGGSDWGKFDIAEVRRAVQTALDEGITVFDTADVYGLGQSELELGKALGKKRHSAFIITKFGVAWKKESYKRAITYKKASASYIRQALENSLKRLRIEAIPLYFLHWPDPETPINETLEELEKFRIEGKILNYGISNFEAQTIKNTKMIFNLKAVQNNYNLLECEESRGIFDIAETLGLVRFAYGPLAQGLLTGKYNQNTRFHLDDRRHRLSKFSSAQWSKNQKVLKALNFVAKRRAKSVAQIAIRWVLQSGKVDIVVTGAKSSEQLKNNIDVLEWSLNDQDIEILNNVIMKNK